METVLKVEVGGRPLSIETGKVAKQASGSVVVKYGDTIVLVTVVSTKEERPTDFLPLTITIFMNFARVTSPNLGSGSTSRFAATLLLGIILNPNELFE